MLKECNHVAIIMDGNGRWAKAQGKPRTAGHLVGADNVRTIAIAASEMGIKYLTLYAFSTENWKRSQDEVSYIMKLPAIFFKKYMQEFLDRGYRMNICMNYGSQREILLAARQYAKDVRDGKADLDLDEEGFEKYLMTKDFPPVDLLIRTSGEERISNYLLWQIAYAELEFVQESWPEFTPEVFHRCLEEYTKRDRRFGGVTNE